jgi:hypothetical protein
MEKNFDNMDNKTLRESLKPVGDPYDWENNDDIMHSDNFRIRLLDLVLNNGRDIRTGKKMTTRPAEEFLKELDELVKLNEMEERNSIEELFEGFDGDYEQVEIDWGKPQGNEIW